MDKTLMSISKRSLGVEGFKSDSRPELTLAQVEKWFPNFIIKEDKSFFIINEIKIKKIRIDEACDRKHYIERVLNV
jgi:hypothetical protein